MIRATHLTSGGGKSAAAVAGYMDNERKEWLDKKGQERAEGYYSGKGAPSEWLGKGAAEYGLSGEVSKEDMIRVLSGITPDGTDISARGGQNQETRRFGEELTVAAPKSVSIVAMEDQRVVEAHQAAVREAIAYVEKEMVHARIGKGGSKGSEFTGNLIAGRYTHEDSRPDAETGRIAPHLHDHVVIANLTKRSDGQWVALKLDWGHENQKKLAADAIYKAALAKNLQELGYEIERGQGANFEIRGISREQIEHFSPRSETIKREIGGERDQVSAREREAVQNRTRERKSGLSQTEQRFEWRREFREVGLDLAALRKSAEARAASGRPREQITAEAALKSAIRHLSERDTTFSRDQLRQEALAAGLGHVSPEQIEQAIDAREGGLVAAGEGKGMKSEQYTTRSAVLREAEILQRARDGKGKAQAIIKDDPAKDSRVVQPVTFTEKELQNERRTIKQRIVTSLEKAVSLATNRLRGLSERHLDADGFRQNPSVLPGDARLDRPADQDLRRPDDRAEPQGRVAEIIKEREAAQGFAFSQGQRAGVELALTSTDRHIGIVGAAGAGKTTSMALIVKEYQAAGYEVIGVAPSAAAAKELESAGCDRTMTLASSLLEKREPEDQSKRLYVLDEAGMVSSKDFDAFYKKADNEGARTLSVGDPLQLQSVEAGTAFKQLLETGAIEHVKIDEIQRQRDPQLREIATAFARGDAARGVELAKPYMRQVEKEKLVSTAADAYLSLSRDDREKTLLLSATNSTRQSINAAIRNGLIQEGSLGNDAKVIKALDKLDLTKEQATQAQNYVDAAGGKVVVQFGRDINDKSGATLAEKGSQWYVTDTTDGKLQLQERENPNRQIEIDPAKVKAISAFVERDMELRDGDKIMFRQNDKDNGITNGSQATIQIAEDGKITANLKTGETVEIDANKAHALDYSYARTVHSSQGATVERAIVVGEASRVSTAESAYVACSREKIGLQIITDNADKLAKSWEKYADRQNAIDVARAKYKTPEALKEIRKEREQAEKGLGSAGDLIGSYDAAGRRIETQQPQQQQPAPTPTPARAPETEMER